MDDRFSFVAYIDVNVEVDADLPRQLTILFANRTADALSVVAITGVAPIQLWNYPKTMLEYSFRVQFR